MRRAEGDAKIVGVFRVKNHDFTPKNQIVSNCGGRRENCWGISCEKSRFYAKKSYFFPIWGGGGGRAECASPGSAPGCVTVTFFETRSCQVDHYSYCNILVTVLVWWYSPVTDQWNLRCIISKLLILLTICVSKYNVVLSELCNGVPLSYLSTGRCSFQEIPGIIDFPHLLIYMNVPV